MDNLKFNYDRNSNKITIFDGTKIIPDEAFMNFYQLEEVVIPDSVIHIGTGAFRGCKSLKKVRLSNNLKVLEAFAFANCSSLEEINIPTSLTYISYGLFSYCKNLKTLDLHDNIFFIDDFGLYNCRKLSNFKLPQNIQSLGIKSLCGCNKIKEINIPKSLNNIDYAALSLMSSLTLITVDINNPKYMDDEGVALFDKNDGVIIQYAINSKQKEYIVGYYSLKMESQIDMEESLDLTFLMYNISDYAFAGAKNLETIYIPSEIESIGAKTFQNCNKLKSLKIFRSAYGKTLLFNVHKRRFEDSSIPFENIEIEDGITMLADNMSDLFMNAQNVVLPSTLEYIGANVFSKSKKLKNLFISDSIKTIFPNSFYPSIKLHIEGVREISAHKFNMLQTKSADDFYFQYIQRGNIRIFSLTDGSYYVKIEDFETIKISKEEIASLSNTSYLLQDEPDIFIDYLNKFLSVTIGPNSLLEELFFNKNLRYKFESFVSDIDPIVGISLEKKKLAIEEFLKEKNLDSEIFFNGILMRELNKEEILNIIENMNTSLQRFFKFSQFFDPEAIEEKISKFDTDLENISSLIDYCNLLEKYKVYDKFLYSPKFYIHLSNDVQELLIKNYNCNIKRMIIESKVLQTDDAENVNLNDLLKFAYVMGVFSDDPILSQKTCTFITEKIFSDELPNGEVNEQRIVGHDIHTIFNELKPRDEIDLEFILFFIENYKVLIETEKKTAGFISRVYNSFEQISKCSTSHKGEQRHLKVTINKCKEYFLMGNQVDITDENKQLVELLAQYYSVDDVLSVANSIIEEARLAPRNIFTKVINDENGNFIYDNDPSNDLKGIVDSGLSYEWLPKQSYDNLVLGKYCNCCAHLEGAGAGIMRASMILDNCQNLVIRDELGNIIAKMTLYVNKEKGFAVFNTVEVSLGNRSDDFLQNIYQAFLEGTNAFCRKYNENNPENPIIDVAIGENRNALNEIFIENHHSEIKPYDTIDYSAFCYCLGDSMVGNYIGDSAKGQFLILTKKTNSQN